MRAILANSAFWDVAELQGDSLRPVAGSLGSSKLGTAWGINEKSVLSVRADDGAGGDGGVHGAGFASHSLSAGLVS